MKAVMPEALPDVLAMRRRTGADRWDEMWEGVLHMPPMPNRNHQELEGAIEAWLRVHWTRPRGNKVYHQINLASIGGWPNDYRIPDLLLLTPDRLAIDRNEYFEGPPTAVVEIRSPGDETAEKMPFYAKLSVPEVWVVDRDSKVPELFVLAGGEYKSQGAADDGWLHSAATGVWLRGEPGAKLVLQLGDDVGTLALLPED